MRKGDLLICVLIVYMDCCIDYVYFWGYVLAQLVEALRYKPEGHGFDSRCHWNFSLT